MLNKYFYRHLDISKEKWEKMTSANGWNAVELRDNRYNQIVHMVSAANGAEEFYSTEVINYSRLNVVHSLKQQFFFSNQTFSFSFFLNDLGACMSIRRC